jgi:hypothetical protein
MKNTCGVEKTSISCKEQHLMRGFEEHPRRCFAEYPRRCSLRAVNGHAKWTTTARETSVIRDETEKSIIRGETEKSITRGEMEKSITRGETECQ